MQSRLSHSREAAALSALGSEVVSEIAAMQIEPPSRVDSHVDKSQLWIQVHPDSALRAVWDRLLYMLCAFSLIFAPIEVAFAHTAAPDTRARLVTIGLVLDVVWLLDIVAWCMTAVYRALPASSTTWPAAARAGSKTSLRDTTGEMRWGLERRPWAILQLYARTWLPLDLLALGPPTVLVVRQTGPVILPALKLLGLTKVLRCSRLFRSAKGSAVDQEHTLVGRVVARRRLFVILWCYLGMVHTLGCFFWLISSLDERATTGGATATATPLAAEPMGGWIADAGLDGAPLGDAYMAALYWAAMTATTVGNGDIVPVGARERAYATICFAVFAVMHSTLLGTVTALIDGLNEPRKAHARRRARVDAFLHFSQLPPKLVRRVHNHLQYEWEVSHSFDMHGVLNSLPRMLRNDVHGYLMREMLLQAPIYRCLERDAQLLLMDELRLSLHCAGETVMLAGTVGHEMFFVRDGTLAVITAEQPPALLSLLKCGDYFGEIALLLPDTRRTASVVAYTDAQLYELSKSSLLRLVKQAPELQKILADRTVAALAQQRDMRHHRESNRSAGGAAGSAQSSRQTAATSPSGIDRPRTISRTPLLSAGRFSSAFAAQRQRMPTRDSGEIRSRLGSNLRSARTSGAQSARSSKSDPSARANTRSPPNEPACDSKLGRPAAKPAEDSPVASMQRAAIMAGALALDVPASAPPPEHQLTSGVRHWARGSHDQHRDEDTHDSAPGLMALLHQLVEEVRRVRERQDELLARQQVQPRRRAPRLGSMESLGGGSPSEGVSPANPRRRPTPRLPRLFDFGGAHAPPSVRVTSTDGVSADDVVGSTSSHAADGRPPE